MDSFFRDFKRFAVVGLSRDPKRFSRKIYDFLKAEGCQLYPVNPSADRIDGERCYQSFAELPDVEAAIFFTNPKVSQELLPACKQRGITNVWFQVGAANPEIIKEAKEIGLVPRNSCVFLHHPNSSLPHKIHRFFHKLIAK